MKKTLVTIVIICFVIILANISGVHIPFLVNAGEILPIFRSEENVKKTELYEEKKITLKIQKKHPKYEVRENSEVFNDVEKNIGNSDYFVKERIEDGFELVPDSFSSSQQGVTHTVSGSIITFDVSSVPCDSLEVSYNIKRIGGKLIVRYVDERGNEIITPDFSICPVGKEYNLKKKEIPGYQYLNVTGEEKGKCIGGTLTITYNYSKIKSLIYNDEDKGRLIVKYIDKETGNEIEDCDESTDDDGEEYVTSEKDILGYECIKVDGEEEGIYEDGITKTVIYYYEKDEDDNNENESLPNIPPPEKPHVETKQGKLIVKYIDEVTNNEISVQEESAENVGEDYTTIKKDIEGYEYVKVDGDEEGTYAEETITVTYYYKKVTQPSTDEIPAIPKDPKGESKKGKLVVKYLDQATEKEIANRYESTGEIGEEYTIVRKEIPEYEYVDNGEEESGNYTEGTITLTYYYDKVDKLLTGKSSKVDSKPGAKLISKRVNSSTKDVVSPPLKQKSLFKNFKTMLPKTGESTPIVNYVAGSMFIIAGLCLSKKFKKNKMYKK